MLLVIRSEIRDCFPCPFRTAGTRTSLVLLESLHPLESERGDLSRK